MPGPNGNGHIPPVPPQPQGPPGGGGIGPASIKIPKKPTKQDLPQHLINDRFPVIPHPYSYSGLYNAANKSYYVYWDEALRDSQQNSLVMRRDGFVDELIRHRVMPVLGLPYHIKVDDPEHPDQQGIAEIVTKIYEDIPYRSYLLRSLMEAVFYGRYGSQIQLGPRNVSGNKWNSVTHHIPVNGDKFRYKWDGTPGIAIYSGSTSTEYYEENAFLEKYSEFIERTMLGNALILKNSFLRDRFVIHRYEPFDTDYLFEIDESQSVFGLGMRSRLYWTWNLGTEILSWMVDALQRVGANGMIYGFFQSGNIAMRDGVVNSLLKLVKDNV